MEDHGLRAHHRGPGYPDAPEMQMRRSARPQFHKILESAGPGTVDTAVDPDDAFDMLLGAIWTRIAVHPGTARGSPVERTVELMVRMLRPDSPPSARGTLTPQ